MGDKRTQAARHHLLLANRFPQPIRIFSLVLTVNNCNIAQMKHGAKVLPGQLKCARQLADGERRWQLRLGGFDIPGLTPQLVGTV